MNTTFHFTSAQEITTDIIDVIRQAYKEKPVSIYIQEIEQFVPEWQIKEVRCREFISKNNSECFLNVDEVISELENELEVT